MRLIEEGTWLRIEISSQHGVDILWPERLDLGNHWETCGLGVEQWNFSVIRDKKEFRNPGQPEDEKVMCKQTYFTNSY